MFTTAEGMEKEAVCLIMFGKREKGKEAVACSTGRGKWEPAEAVFGMGKEAVCVCVFQPSVFDHVHSSKKLLFTVGFMATETTSVLTVDTVCGTLQVKLLTRDLTCGSSRYIDFGSRMLTPCEFQAA